MGVRLDKEHLYEHVPNSVETSHECMVTILWNQQLKTDGTIPNNKPDIIICVNETIHNNKLDIIIHDTETGTCLLIDTAILGDVNVIKKGAIRIYKTKTLQ
jgi:hypothetical protein